MEAKRTKRSFGDYNKEEIFVELWQQMPCLHDVTSSSYHDLVKKDLAWKEIAVELQLPSE